MLIKTLTTLVLAIILFTSFISSASAQIISNNVSVEIRLAPSQIEATEGEYSIGYVNLINRAGIPVKPQQDVTIRLTSAYPDIATVPEFVTIKSDSLYTSFNIGVKGTGTTAIFASFNDQTVFEELIVGESDTELPDNIELVIHLPAEEMHVESEMPFSVFLQDLQGNVIQAPYDITVKFDYEESLVSLNEKEWVIKKGAYYAWGTISTGELVGTAFLRASQSDLNVHTAHNVKISSSLPTGLKVNVFPQILPKVHEQNMDIIVSLVDSDGFPALAQEDVKLEFFADNTYVGDEIDKTMEEARSNGVIKKGDFSFHFRESLNLNNQGNEITIGASAEGLGIAFDCFEIRDSFTSENKIVENKTMHVFTLDQIPSNSKTVGIYQIGALLDVLEEGSSEEEEDDQPCVDSERFDIDPRNTDKEVRFHPILSNENLSSEGILQKVNLISSNNLLLNIQGKGTVESGTSYGTATIISGKETGSASLSATIKGIGSATSDTAIVNTLKHDKTMIFSPIGSNTILFDKNGKFDLFVIALDGRDRPTFVENEAKYLLLPINELVEIEKEKTFAHSNFPSESFATNDEDPVTMEAIPVGVSAQESLKAVTSYARNPSSQVQIILPYPEIDANSNNPYVGIVQLEDFRGNPIIVSNDLKVKIESTLPEGSARLVQTPKFVTINEGSSYASFNIVPLGASGFSGLKANANGVIGSEVDIETRSFLTQLSISTGVVNEPLTPGETIELKVYVDDQYLESVPGASLRIVSDGHATVTPLNIKTESDGSAKIHFTPSRSHDSMSLQIFATAEGYVEDQRTFQYSVATDGSDSSLALGVPDWIVYIGIAVVVVIMAVMLLFLKKPKRVDDEEDELELFEDDEI